jgi:UDP-2,3-diacylglucosamine hydrolase
VLFLSDFHLGIPDKESSLEREKKICHFLKSKKEILSDVYLVGDLFDFWFEYKTAIPKGYYRLLGTLAEMVDEGINLHYFTGNHDMWIKDSMMTDLGIQIYRNPIVRTINGKKFYIGHGDGLGPGDHQYKMLKKIFASPACQWLFGWIHPDLGIGLANFFSKQSRHTSKTKKEETYFGNEREWLYIFASNYLKNNDASIDYFIFGHRHLPIYTKINESNSKYINLGDWINYFTYALFDGNDVSLYQYGTQKSNVDFDPNV